MHVYRPYDNYTPTFFRSDILSDTLWIIRLLEYYNDSKFSLIEFFDNIPLYAILLHTWGLEEVTFKDMIEGNRRSKTGFKKIWFYREQARRDGWQYFWVDTYYINKSSSAELTEAINSMFR